VRIVFVPDPLPAGRKKMKRSEIKAATLKRTAKVISALFLTDQPKI
jgi:hypothetical protein